LSKRAIAHLGTLFVVLFAVLALAQVSMQVVAGPATSANALNPRRTNPAQGRGDIVASDGTVIAESVGSKRVYPEGPLLAQAVGYVSQRYGATGLEASFNRFLSAPASGSDPVAQLRAIFNRADRLPPRGARLVTTIDLPTQRELVAQLSKYPRGAGIVLDPLTGDVLALCATIRKARCSIAAPRVCIRRGRRSRYSRPQPLSTSGS
jgi:peptidoglycan glycosyltransferase